MNKKNIIAIIVFALLIFSRCPQTLLHAQFWAEDGVLWYTQAYQFGWNSFFISNSAYFQTISRLIAYISLPFGLEKAPTIYALFAFLFQLLPISYLLSNRLSNLCPSWTGRFLFGCLLCVLPNTLEIYVNLTNSQWHLAFCTLLILIAEPSSKKLIQIAELLVIAISGLSGPFCVLLFPVAIIITWLYPNRARKERLLILTLGCFVQSISLFQTLHADRSNLSLGASFVTFAQILNTQIFGASLFGTFNMSKIVKTSLWEDNIFQIAMLIFFSAYLIGVLYKTNNAIRFICLFAGILLCTSLITPQISLTDPQWPMLTIPYAGGRYFFMPLVAWAAVVTFTCASSNKALCSISIIFMITTICFAIPGDWKQNKKNTPGYWKNNEYMYKNFRVLAKKFDHAKPGEKFEITLSPNVIMHLTR